MWDLSDRDQMLGDLIHNIQHLKDLNHLYVDFFSKDGELVGTLSFPKALDALFNEVFHFEEFDLSNTVSIKIRS